MSQDAMNMTPRGAEKSTPQLSVSFNGWINALIATFALSVTAPVGRAAILGGMHPTGMQALRFGLAWLLLAGTLRRRAAAAGAARRMDRRGILMCLLTGAFSGAASVSYAWSLQSLNASISSMLVNLYPLVVLALLALRGERLTRWSVIRLALGLGGVYLILGPSGQASLIGAALALATAVCFAVSLALNQWYLNRYPSQTVTFYIVGITAMFILGTWLTQGLPWQPPNWRGWLAVITLAVLCTYISRLAMFRAIQQIGSGQVALLAPLETLLTVIWSVVFLSERLSLPEWIGGALVLGSALLAIPARQQQGAPQAEPFAVE